MFIQGSYTVLDISLQFKIIDPVPDSTAFTPEVFITSFRKTLDQTIKLSKTEKKEKRFSLKTMNVNECYFKIDILIKPLMRPVFTFSTSKQKEVTIKPSITQQIIDFIESAKENGRSATEIAIQFKNVTLSKTRKEILISLIETGEIVCGKKGDKTKSRKTSKTYFSSMYAKEEKEKAVTE